MDDMGPVSSQGVVVRSKSWMVLPAGEEGIESENHRMAGWYGMVICIPT